MAQHARPVGPAGQNNAAAFSLEMVQGSGPPVRSPILARWLPLHVGWISAQTTHVAAPHEPAMVAGSKPDRNREWLPLRTGWTAAQLTHVDAPFEPAMV